MDRFSAYLIVVVGATIGWLVTAILYVKTRTSVALVAWIVLFVVCRIGMRNWPEIKPFLFFSVLGGGMIGLVFTPAIHGRFRIESIADLLEFGGPFGDVTGSLIGAVLITFVVVTMTPKENAH